MRLEMSPRTRRTTGKSKKRLEVDKGKVAVLKDSGENKAFFFYEAIGKPIGESANNLTEFLSKLDTVKQESLEFHMQRQDFRNWIDKSLGNRKLAEKIGRIRSWNDKNLRGRIQTTIKRHLRQSGNVRSGMVVDDADMLLQPEAK
jgi:hypothetical protein